MAEKEYKFVDFYGTTAIVWSHNESEAHDNHAKTRRRQLKDKVGRDNYNMPMFDLKLATNGLEYCDIILCSENILAWETAIKQHYKDWIITKKDIRGGHQLAVVTKLDDKVLVTVNFYMKSNKLMVQPGDQKPQNLLDFMTSFPAISALRLDTGEIDALVALNNTKMTERDGEGDGTAPKSPETESLITTDDVTMHKVIDSMPVSGDNNSTTVISEPEMVSVCVQTHTDTEVSATQTDLMNKAADMDTQTDAIPEYVESSAENTKQHVHNRSTQTILAGADKSIYANLSVHDELLCFVRHQMHSIPVDSVVRLCANFYCVEDITASKKWLFDNLNIGNWRYIKRTGLDKKRDDMYDIMRVMLEVQPGEMPDFYAVNLANLPPLRNNSADTLKLLQEIENMKNDIKLLTEGHKNLFDLVKQQVTSAASSGTQAVQCGTQTTISTPADTHMITNDHADPPIIVDSEGQSDTNGDAETDEQEHTPALTRRYPFEVYNRFEPLQDHSSATGNRDTMERQCHNVRPMDKESLGRTSGIQSSVDRQSRARAGGMQSPMFKQNYDRAGGVQYRAHGMQPNLVKQSHDRSGGVQYHMNKLSHGRAGGMQSPVFTRVFSRRNDQNNQPTRGSSSVKQYMLGKGTFVNLQGIEYHNKLSTGVQKQNRICIGVFVSRLKPKTSETLVERHVLQELGIKVKAEKLETKYDSYSSFLIRCDGFIRSNLLDIERWPTNVLIKPFMK